MSLADIEAFLAVVRTGTVVNAARELHLSQPAVSRRIAHLERETGAKLFERVGRRLQLSPAGVVYESYAQAAVAHLHDGRQAVQEHRNAAGTINLVLVGTLANPTFLTRLASFRDRHPDIDVRVGTRNSAGVSELVRHGKADVGVRYDVAHDGNTSGLAVVRSYTEALVPIGRPSRAKAMSNRWYIFPAAGVQPDPYRRALDRYLALTCEPDTEIDLVEVDSLTAQLCLVSAGFGQAIVPSTSLDMLPAKAVRRLPCAVELELAVQVIARPGNIARDVVHQLVNEIAHQKSQDDAR